MPIVSFNFEKISVEKKASASVGKVTIKNNHSCILKLKLAPYEGFKNPKNDTALVANNIIKT